MTKNFTNWLTENGKEPDWNIYESVHVCGVANFGTDAEFIMPNTGDTRVPNYWVVCGMDEEGDLVELHEFNDKLDAEKCRDAINKAHFVNQVVLRLSFDDAEFIPENVAQWLLGCIEDSESEMNVVVKKIA